MPKTIIYIKVLGDGVGDFSHFVDIYTALKANPKLNHHEIISIVCSDRRDIIKRTKQLKLENCHVFYTSKEMETQVAQNEKIVEDLAQADQILVVSNGGDLSLISKYLPQNVSSKYIGEHERYAQDEGDKREKPNDSMGLHKSLKGIKLKNLPKITLEKFLEILADDNPDLFRILLGSEAKPESIQAFASRNKLVPAYFTNSSGLLSFVDFLALNKNLSSNQELHIYVSGLTKISHPGFISHEVAQLSVDEFQAKHNCIGKTKDEIALELNASIPMLRDMQSDIKEIQLIQKMESGYEQTKISVNPQGTRNLVLYLGFYLKDCYDLLYQQATLAGISGDNTLEKAISSKAFPFYLSTNFSQKYRSFKTIYELCQTLDLPEKVKSDYLTYFGEIAKWKSVKYSTACDTFDAMVSAKFSELDLQSM